MATISDIVTEARSLCDADTTSYPAAEMLRRVNDAYEQLVGKIIGQDGTWQFDDTNFTDFPIATTTLVNSQHDYAFDTAHLEIERVEVLDVNGLWLKLNPIDKSHISGAIDEFYKEDGTPIYYDKDGKSVILYPAPATGYVTMASGLKIYFQRTADVFTSAQVTTGTKTPGFASPWHYILAYRAAIPYCMKYKKDRVALYEMKAEKMERELLNFYARREKDVRKVLRPAGISFR